jgi:hypothetical protein
MTIVLCYNISVAYVVGPRSVVWLHLCMCILMVDELAVD